MLRLRQRAIWMTSSNSCVPAAADTAELSGVRVLIVEDSWDVGTGLKMLLEAWGAEIVGPVATSADARRLVSERTADVALVDINLRNGEQSYQLIDWLHERSIRIVVISGYPDVAQAKTKAVAILPKPMREDLLLASLRSAR
jgi:DNA-binding NtrC family response regulator